KPIIRRGSAELDVCLVDRVAMGRDSAHGSLRRYKLVCMLCFIFIHAVSAPPTSNDTRPQGRRESDLERDHSELELARALCCKPRCRSENQRLRCLCIASRAGIYQPLLVNQNTNWCCLELSNYPPHAFPRTGSGRPRATRACPLNICAAYFG